MMWCHVDRSKYLNISSHVVKPPACADLAQITRRQKCHEKAPRSTESSAARVIRNNRAERVRLISVNTPNTETRIGARNATNCTDHSTESRNAMVRADRDHPASRVERPDQKAKRREGRISVGSEGTRRCWSRGR